MENGRGNGSAWPVVVFGAALAAGLSVRYLLPPFGSVTIYPQVAADLLSGKLAPDRVADFSPFTLRLHVLAARLAGPGPAGLHLVEICAAALAAALLFSLGRRLFGPLAGSMAAGFLVLSPGMLVFPQVFVPEVWSVLFGLAAGLAFVVHLDGGRPLPLALAGLSVGLSVAVRPTALAVAPAFVLALALVPGGSGRRLRSMAMRCAAFLVPLVVLLGALAAHNRSWTGNASLAVMSPGPLFWGSNNPYARGTCVDSLLVKETEILMRGEADPAHVLWRRIPSAVTGRSFDGKASSAWWSAMAWRFLSENPGAALRLAGEKAELLFGGTELHDARAGFELEKMLRDSHVPIVPVPLVAALALPGILLSRRDWRRLLPFQGAVLVNAGVLLVFFPSARYRLALLPLLALFAGATVQAVRDRWVRGGRRTAALPALAAALLFVLFSGTPEAAVRWSHTWRAEVEATRLRADAAGLRSRNERAAAAEVVVRSIVRAPFYADHLVLANLSYGPGAPEAAALLLERAAPDPAGDARFDRALLLVQLGRGREARPLLEALDREGGTFDRLAHVSPLPAVHLARIAAWMEGDLEKAAGLLARALRARPGDPDALAHLSVVAGRRGLSAEADAARKRLFAYFPPTDATFTLGVALEESGDHAGAARCFLQVASWLPELRRAHLLAAASLGAVGETSRAVAEAEKAFALREDPAPMRGPILAPYEALVRADPGSAVASFLLARTLRRYGEFDRAEAVAESALEKDPSFEPARRELALLGVARAKP